MRGLRVVLVLGLVATVALAGCPDGGEDGGGYVHGDDADESLDAGEPREVGAQAPSLSAWNTSGSVPGSTNT